MIKKKFTPFNVFILLNFLINIKADKLDESLVPDSAVQFFIYCSLDHVGTIITVGDSNGLKQTCFDPHYKTVIITHGFRSSSSENSCVLARDEYLKSAYPHNVIVIDWSWFVSTILYPWVVEQIPIASRRVTQMIDFLSTEGMDCSRLVLVGHSLGAHMLGVAGYQARCQVARMVALDPAGPKFEDHETPTLGVTRNSSKLVEVIHTNGDAYGIWKPRGHLDFFVNGGITQPGCEDSFFKRLVNAVVSPEASMCAHSRAYRYYAESINSEKGFYGLKCPGPLFDRNQDCNGPVEEMSGLNLKSHVFGTFYVPINDREPFAMGINPDNHNFDIVKDQQIQFDLYCGMIVAGELFGPGSPCFDAEKITVFAVHGWSTTYDKSFESIKDALLKKNAYNVITLNWTEISKDSSYDWVAYRVKPIAEKVAKVIDRLVTDFHMDCEKVVLVGHSMGAHIMGIAGYKANCQVAFLTGLDPAKELFENHGPGQAISKESAMNVEIIHTGADHNGIWEPIGHADFYVNGGRKQPACASLIDMCHSSMAAFYYAESVRSSIGFRGQRCSDLQKLTVRSCDDTETNMGGVKLRLDSEGLFYVKTNEHPPYAFGALSELNTDVTFTLYCVEKGSEISRIFELTDISSVQKSCFNKQVPTTIFVHGWRSSSYDLLTSALEDEFQKQRVDINAIFVDWRKKADNSYLTAVGEIELVSDAVRKMIDLLRFEGLLCSQLTFVGHSLGTYILGLTASNVNCYVSHLIGLDPPLVLLKEEDVEKMISLEAADTVEIIHTNPTSESTKAMGDIDFFINGGTGQPNCLVDDDECLSNRALELYVETLRSNPGFYGRKCSDPDHITWESCQGKAARMGGFQTKVKSTGIFYVRTSTDPPYRSVLEWNNQSPAQSGIDEYVDIHISCGHNLKSNNLVLGSMESLKSSCFKTSYPTVIFTHGWRDSSHALASKKLKTELLQHGSYNIIFIDWKKYSRNSLDKARNSMGAVIKTISELIDFLKRVMDDNLDRVTVIGHSLGAQILGDALLGLKLRVGHFIGLDPEATVHRKFVEVADYVEIIHTGDPNGTTIGHADFFVNGGKEQIGCMVYEIIECSSNRALELYIESLNLSDFYGYRCSDPNLIDFKSCVGEEARMGGLEITTKTRGLFYVKTNRTPLYSLNVKKIFQQ